MLSLYITHFDVDIRGVYLRVILAHHRLAVLGKLNSLVKEWISEISDLKVRKDFPSYYVKMSLTTITTCAAYNNHQSVKGSKVHTRSVSFMFV